MEIMVNLILAGWGEGDEGGGGGLKGIGILEA